MNKVCKIFLVIMLLAVCFPFSAFAEEDTGAECGL